MEAPSSDGPYPLRRVLTGRKSRRAAPLPSRGKNARRWEDDAHDWKGSSLSARPARCSASSVTLPFGGAAETKKALTSLLQVTSPALRSGVGRFPPACRSSWQLSGLLSGDPTDRHATTGTCEFGQWGDRGFASPMQGASCGKMRRGICSPERHGASTSGARRRHGLQAIFPRAHKRGR